MVFSSFLREGDQVVRVFLLPADGISVWLVAAAAACWLTFHQYSCGSEAHLNAVLESGLRRCGSPGRWAATSEAFRLSYIGAARSSRG